MATPPINPLFAVIMGARAQQGDLSIAGALPPGDDLFTYADVAKASNALTAAGCSSVAFRDLTLHFHTRHLTQDLGRFYRSASARSHTLYVAQSPAVRGRRRPDRRSDG